MSTTRNKYGLSRNIPNRVKLKIRQRSGFGCVVCGRGVTHYDHVDPEWKDSKRHDPLKMTQLCGYCHDLKTRGIYTKERIKKAAENPKCFENGFVFAPFLLSSATPVIHLGNSIFHGVETLLRINGEDIIKLIQKSNSILMYFDFYDSKGKKLFWIKDETWYSNLNTWDIEITGEKIILKEVKSKTSLYIENDQKNNRLIIKEIKMYYKNWSINGSNKYIELISPIGEKYVIEQGAEISCGTAFELNNNSFSFGIAGKSLVSGKAKIRFNR